MSLRFLSCASLLIFLVQCDKDKKVGKSGFTYESIASCFLSESYENAPDPRFVFGKYNICIEVIKGPKDCDKIEPFVLFHTRSEGYDPKRSVHAIESCKKDIKQLPLGVCHLPATQAGRPELVEFRYTAPFNQVATEEKAACEQEGGHWYNYQELLQ